MTDAAWMQRAIELSRRGFPAPNPHVGCVLVRDGHVVGEGWHEQAGKPHAEAIALANAGASARGSTAYVTLEPCDHFGRTPPCSLALIEAGVKRVVIACEDPNLKAAGGADRLRAAGIEVVTGVETGRAARANRQFLASLALGRPLIYGKMAISLDGRVALSNGLSRWITGLQTRWYAHRLRAYAGAVLVGRHTVEMDDPSLTVRFPEFNAFHHGRDVIGWQPLRIVLDPGAKLSRSHRVFDGEADTWHVTGAIDLDILVADLASRGVRGLLVEGGPTTLRHFLDADLIDELHLHQSMKMLGNGPSWYEAPEVRSVPVESSLIPSRDIRTLSNGDRLTTFIPRTRLDNPALGRLLLDREGPINSSVFETNIEPGRSISVEPNRGGNR